MISSVPAGIGADSLSRETNNKAPGDGRNTGMAAHSNFGIFLAHKIEGNMAIDFLGVFHDYDTSGFAYATRVSDYEANPAVLIDVNMWDPRAAQNGQWSRRPLAGALGAIWCCANWAA